VDLGGTAINYTFLNRQERFLVERLCEHPARAREGPGICLQQIEDGLAVAGAQVGIQLSDIAVLGLDTPGPASAAGIFSTRGSTNFVHRDWAGFNIRESLAKRLGKPVVYLNDGNAAALWGHFVLFGTNDPATSVSAIIGTGLGGGVITHGNVVKGRKGFGGELGHVLLPYHSLNAIKGIQPLCNCGRPGDLESICSLTAIERTLLPFFLQQHPEHPLSKIENMRQAAKLVRGLAESGDLLCKDIFRVQAQALGLFFDEMINIFDPDALIVGGGALETQAEFQHWFINEIRAGMPSQREEQLDIPILVMPNGDTAGARGAAIEALKFARHSGAI
jgi:predicted NBD/HSP70 family sugar kinase